MMWLDKITPKQLINSPNRKIIFIALLFNIVCSLGGIYWLRTNIDLKNDRPSNAQANRISEDYWPTVQFQGWFPLPAKESVVNNVDEFNYFSQWTKTIEEGINNRYNIVSVLEAKRANKDYLEMFQIFRNKQDSFIGRLRTMPIPERLQSFHDAVIEAASDQINFYEEWARQKDENQNIKLNDLTANGDLKRCNELLWKAYHQFQNLYPTSDKATNDAIEMRLCQFDII